MAKLLLGISGRIEEGESLSAVVFNTATGTAALTGFTLQWQVFSGGAWTNTGAANALSLAVPTGGAGRAYRLTATPAQSGDEATVSAATANATVDTNKIHAPTFADLAASVTAAEGATGTVLDSAVTFDDVDNDAYAGGSLVVLNSNSAAAGGDGLDVLSLRNQGTGVGQVSFNASTREVSYSAKVNQPVVIGTVNATQNGNGTDLAISFNANATKVAVDKVIENLTWGNTDDSPTTARLLTIRVVDNTGGSVQRVIQGNITPSADAPVITSAASFAVDENTTTVGTLAALDPDREATAAQGITWSLVSGTGSTHNASFALDANTGALRFVSAPDFEAQGSYSLRVRATDSGGAISEQVVAVTVRDVAEAPVFTSPASYTVDENTTAVGSVAASDPDRAAGSNQGITYSLVAGTGSTDNALFAIDGSTGALRFVAAPDFESAHSATYNVRVRASDSNAGITDQSIAVAVRNVNETPAAQAISASVLEDAASVTLAPSFTDPDSGDTHSLSLNSTGTVGLVTLSGSSFVYSPNGKFNQLRAGSTASDTFSYTVTDAGGLSSTRTATVTIVGANDAAGAITGDTTAALVEDMNVFADTLVATGRLSVTDPDQDESVFRVQSGVSANGLGQYNINSDGWTVIVRNSTIQGLQAGATATDTFTATSFDGTRSQTITFAVTGTNDIASVSPSAAYVTADSPNASGQLVASGRVRVSDVDLGENHPIARTNVQGAYGTFNTDASGNWTWTADAANAGIKALPAGVVARDSMTVQSADGTASGQVDVWITGANDAPILVGSQQAAGSVVEAGAANGGTVVATGVLRAQDPDGEALTWSIAGASTYGNISIANDGTWTYTLDNSRSSTNSLRPGDQVTETFVAKATDGSGASASIPVQISVMGTNDAPTIPNQGATYWAHEADAPDGTLTIQLGSTGYDYGRTFAFDHSGHVLIGGESRTADGGDPYAIGVTRLATDGTLDSQFSGDGVARLPNGGRGYGITVDPAGNIYAIGSVPSGVGGASSIAVARLYADGSIDTGYGAGGLATVNTGSYSQSAHRGWLQPDGKLLVQIDGGYQLENTFVRFTSGGSLDSTFGANGVFVAPNVTSTYSGSPAFTADAQGRIWSVQDSGSNSAVRVWRWTADGQSDTSFGTDGHVDVPIFNYYGTLRITPFSSGGVAVAAAGGIVRVDDGGSVIARYRDVVSVGDMKEGPAGTLMIASVDRNEDSDNIVVARYLADGTLDASFGGGGVVRTDIGRGESVDSVQVAPDGHVMVGGSTYIGSGRDIFVALYESDGSLVSSFGRGTDRPISGQLYAYDPEQYAGFVWNGGGNGTYGTFSLNGSTGDWQYLIDSARPATNALSQGQVVTDSTHVTVTDAYGATAGYDIVVQIVGSYDPELGA